MLAIFVEKGTADGHKITYKSSADEYINVRTGNVVIQIQEIPHAVYERKQNDLRITIDITLKEALLGFKKTLTHLDGHTVVVDRLNQVTKPGLQIRIKNEGMPVFEQYGDYGDLIVTCTVNLPKQLTSEQQRLFRDLFRN
jgi:DnaJ-class molecular chaperone